jgi:acyl-CoA reductase-like NAD-dependent aldehyde dehydrogenase
VPLMTIDGRLTQAARSFDVLNPATAGLLDRAPSCSVEQLDEAVSSARSAFTAWRGTAVEQRRAMLRACAARVREHRDSLARMITLEQGRPTATAQREVLGAAKWIEHTAGLAIPGETVALDGNRTAEVTRRPFGVVGAIVPWNYPLMSAAWKIAPALLAGNTVILKPSPYTPLATLRLGELLLDLLPRGVLNVLSGPDELGAWITTHPAIRKISFTGSIATGRKVYAAAAADVKGLTLEMGGNDPAIVLGDVDPKAVASRIYAAAFENAGQVCAAIKRVYVHRSRHDALVAELAGLAAQAIVGSGLEEGVTMGPLSNAPQYRKVLELMSAARADGGVFAAGRPEPLPRPGYFVAPAIVTGLSDRSRVVAEEQFGPVLPVLPFDEVSEAVERANATPFGLSASVWSADAAQARTVAQQVDAGTVWINQHMSILPQLPTVGLKSSGLGAENGLWGLECYLQIQTISAAA